MSGNKVIGKVNSDINPSKRRMIDTTVDKTGLSINLFIMLLIYIDSIFLKEQLSDYLFDEI